MALLINSHNETVTLFDKTGQIAKKVWIPQFSGNKHQTFDHSQVGHPFFDECKAVHYMYTGDVSEREKVLEIRNELEIESGMIFQKVIAPFGKMSLPTENSTLKEELRRLFRFFRICGFVARYQDTSHFRSAEEIMRALRLDWYYEDGKPGLFLITDDESGSETFVDHAFALRYGIGATTATKTFYTTPLCGRTEDDLSRFWEKYRSNPHYAMLVNGEPCTGHGFTAFKPELIPEMYVNENHAMIPADAEVYLLTNNGSYNELLVAVRTEGEWFFTF